MMKKECQRGIILVSFIYNHTVTFNMMRKYTDKAELVRANIIRFATHFLTLQRLHKMKNNLDDLSGLSVSKKHKGKKAKDIFFIPSFWNDVVYTLKGCGTSYASTKVCW